MRPGSVGCRSSAEAGTRRAEGGGVDDVTKAKLQVRLVVATYRQQISRNIGDSAAAAAFRERAWPILEAVQRDHAGEPEIARVLAEARNELGADAD